jgi:hypothetical protein
MLKKVISILILFSGVIFSESGVGININRYDLEVEGTLDSRNLEATQNLNSIFIGYFDFINVDKDNKSDKLVGAGVGVTNKFDAVEGVELTFGAKFILSSINNDDKNIDKWFFAMPLFTVVRYNFPPLMFNIPPVAVEGTLAYGPGPLAFGEADNYSEFKLSGDIQMIPNVRIYAGYRHIVTGFKADKNYLFSNGFYGGLKFVY